MTFEANREGHLDRGTMMEALIQSRFLRTVVLATTAALATGGCYGWTTVERPGDFAARHERVDYAVVTDTLGNEFPIENLSLDQGLWRGQHRVSGEPMALSEREIGQIQVREFKGGKTLGAVFGTLGGAALMVGILALTIPDCLYLCPED